MRGIVEDALTSRVAVYFRHNQNSNTLKPEPENSCFCQNFSLMYEQRRIPFFFYIFLKKT
jgi:hypothetical protein